jgi:hypothetical protein
LRYYLVPGIYTPRLPPRACTPHREAPKYLGPRGLVAAVVPYSRASSGSFPATPAMIEDGRATWIIPALFGGSWRLVGVVPDGVASIAVTVGAHPATQTLVTGNFVDAVVPEPHGSDTITQRWYAADGTVVRTVTGQVGAVLTISG